MKVPPAFFVIAREVESQTPVMFQHHTRPLWISCLDTSTGTVSSFTQEALMEVTQGSLPEFYPPVEWTREQMQEHRKQPAQKRAERSRREARKKLVGMGLLVTKHDPRQVHHVDFNPLNNNLNNLVALNHCAHKKQHGGKCNPKTRDKDIRDETQFPSFGFDGHGKAVRFRSPQKSITQ
jgi:hypothetical protein